jgi:hypothetical protein
MTFQQAGSESNTDPQETVENAAPRRGMNIIVCQDSSDVHRRVQSIAAQLGKQGIDLRLTSVDNQPQLVELLEDLRTKGAEPPDAVFMDVCGVGEVAAKKVIQWFDKNHPGRPLPALNFLSLDLGMAITEAIRLRDADCRAMAGYVDPYELSWLESTLAGSKESDFPGSTTFREILNTRFGMDFPLGCTVDSYYEEAIKKFKGITNDRVIEAWQGGQLSATEAVERLRGVASGIANALQDGFYGLQAGGEMEADARFYASAGFPFKGRAVFSIDEVRNWRDDDKPVLFMQSYDPAVVPLLASGQLGGLVATSPYMASHLKLLCETHMVSGLFGMMPPGRKSLTSEFNEEAKPDLPPWFDKGCAEINGQTVRAGQPVLVGLGGDGLMLQPPKTIEVRPLDLDAAEDDLKLRADLRLLRQIGQCFKTVFADKGVTPHGVKLNIDTVRGNVLRQAEGIGLIRTEQMVATNGGQARELREYLLGGGQYPLRCMLDDAEYAYSSLFAPLNDGKPVKIRLFDFVHREILDAQDQKLFLRRHGQLDFHGGEALDRWPELYRGQVRAIFSALKSARITTDTPLEIMMPAIRTEEDVLKVKKIVTEEASYAGLGPARYSFGVMVETLEACKNISAIAPHCDFISFGTNDLTAEQFGMSRSDLKAHANFAGRHGYNPFKHLAPELLSIMREVTEKGRAANPKLKVDVCGAQAAHAPTAAKLFAAGIDNISVAPSLSNLYALPVQLAYLALDALQPRVPAPGPSPSA